MRSSVISSMQGMVATFAMLALSAAHAGPFNSGSTGADGIFNPTENIIVPVPASGIFNYTSVNIPAGVTVTYQKNAANTPVVILASADVVIAGTINVNGKHAATILGPNQANQPDGGQGGPGGFDGGRGGAVNQGHGAQGLGPGGGRGGNYSSSVCTYYSTHSQGGGGGGFAVGGQDSYCERSYNGTTIHGQGGPAYGSASMLPMVGGSGGGGGSGPRDGTGAPGGGGGGGGGALLIAANGTVTLSGQILAVGGNGALPKSGCTVGDPNVGGSGGGGAGGAVRILATAFNGAGTMNVSGGSGACNTSPYHGGGHGSVGRSSIETLRGGTLTFNGLPGVSITHVAGVAVPAQPTGMGDVVLPPNQPNPVAVSIAASNVPLGTPIKLVLTPYFGGDAVSVDSSGLAGSFENSTATASIDIPSGPSVMIAQVSFALQLAMGEALSMYAQGEQVERVVLSAAPGGATRYHLQTVSGKQFEVAAAVVLAALAG